MTEIFKFLPGDRVNYVFAMPGYDSYPVEIVADEGGDEVTIRQGPGLYGQGSPLVERAVRRASIIWMRGSPVSQRFRAWSDWQDYLHKKAAPCIGRGCTT